MNGKKAKRLRKIVKKEYEKVASSQTKKEYNDLKEMYKKGDITLK